MSFKFQAVTVVFLGLAGCSASKGVAPATAEEKMAAKWIMANADDPESVKFASWGPHWLDDAPAKIVRVVYRSKNKAGALALNDELIFIVQGKAVNRRANLDGDHYREATKAMLETLKKWDGVSGLAEQAEKAVPK